jgi:UDP:flavonoid glycosyltransferase YjiC (YdhE family)
VKEGPVRVLFSSTSGYGHVFPMLPLARAFVAAGHEVLWAVGPDSHRHLTAAGIATTPAGLSDTGRREATADLLAAAEGLAPPLRAGFVFPRMFGAALTPPMVDDLLPLAKQWGPDLLIHEQAELAAPLVGALLGLPCVTHAFGGAVPAPFLAEAGERLAPLWATHGRTPPSYAGCFAPLYLDICPPSVQSVSTTHIDAVQPLRPVADTGATPTTVPDHLEDDGRPLVYLTLGTVRNHSPVLRPAADALAALPVRLLVTVGPDGDPAALGSPPPNVRVERWVDQPQVLQHASVVVSHGGSGTFLGALTRGLPQLCLPQAADQFRNAEGGRLSGAALVLTPPEATPEAIAGAVTRLLTDERFRRDATRAADEIRAMPSPAEIADQLVGRFGSA